MFFNYSKEKKYKNVLLIFFLYIIFFVSKYYSGKTLTYNYSLIPFDIKTKERSPWNFIKNDLYEIKRKQRRKELHASDIAKTFENTIPEEYIKYNIPEEPIYPYISVPDNLYTKKYNGNDNDNLNDKQEKDKNVAELTHGLKKMSFEEYKKWNEENMKESKELPEPTIEDYIEDVEYEKYIHPALIKNVDVNNPRYSLYFLNDKIKHDPDDCATLNCFDKNDLEDDLTEYDAAFNGIGPWPSTQELIEHENNIEYDKTDMEMEYNITYDKTGYYEYKEKLMNEQMKGIKKNDMNMNNSDTLHDSATTMQNDQMKDKEESNKNCMNKTEINHNNINSNNSSGNNDVLTNNDLFCLLHNEKKITTNDVRKLYYKKEIKNIKEAKEEIIKWDERKNVSRSKWTLNKDEINLFPPYVKKLYYENYEKYRKEKDEEINNINKNSAGSELFMNMRDVYDNKENLTSWTNDHMNEKMNNISDITIPSVKIGRLNELTKLYGNNPSSNDIMDDIRNNINDKPLNNMMMMDKINDHMNQKFGQEYNNNNNNNNNMESQNKYTNFRLLEDNVLYTRSKSPINEILYEWDDPLNCLWRKRTEDVIRDVIMYDFPFKELRRPSNLDLYDVTWYAGKIDIFVTVEEGRNYKITLFDLKQLVKKIAERLKELEIEDEIVILPFFELVVSSLPKKNILICRRDWNNNIGKEVVVFFKDNILQPVEGILLGSPSVFHVIINANNKKILNFVINNIDKIVLKNTQDELKDNIILKAAISPSDSQSGNQSGNQSGSQSGSKSGSQSGSKSGSKSGSTSDIDNNNNKNINEQNRRAINENSNFEKDIKQIDDEDIYDQVDNTYDKENIKNEFKDIEFDDLDKLRNVNKTSKDRNVNVMKNINNLDQDQNDLNNIINEEDEQEDQEAEDNDEYDDDDMDNDIDSDIDSDIDRDIDSDMDNDMDNDMDDDMDNDIDSYDNDYNDYS